MQKNHLSGTVQPQTLPDAPHLIAGKQSDTAKAAGLHHEAAAAPLGNDADSTRTCNPAPSPSQRADSQVN